MVVVLVCCDWVLFFGEEGGEEGVQRGEVGISMEHISGRKCLLNLSCSEPLDATIDALAVLFVRTGELKSKRRWFVGDQNVTTNFKDWVATGVTEVVRHTSKPLFARSFEFGYEPNNNQAVRVEIYHFKEGVGRSRLELLQTNLMDNVDLLQKMQFIGAVESLLDKALNGNTMAVADLKIENVMKRGQAIGCIGLEFEDVNLESNRLVSFNFGLYSSLRSHVAAGLKSRSVLGRSSGNYGYSIYREKEEDKWILVHRMKSALSSDLKTPLNFETFESSMLLLAAGDPNRALKIEVWEQDRDDSKVVAAFEFTVAQLEEVCATLVDSGPVCSFLFAFGLRGLFCL